MMRKGVERMATLVELLRRATGHGDEQVGFVGAKGGSRPAPLVLIAALPALDAALVQAAVEGGADALVLRPDTIGDHLQEAVAKADGRPWGLRLARQAPISGESNRTAEQASLSAEMGRVVGMGCDFVIMDAHEAAATSLSTAMGHVVTVTPTIPPDLLAALSTVPSIDAVEAAVVAARLLAH